MCADRQGRRPDGGLGASARGGEKREEERRGEDAEAQAAREAPAGRESRPADASERSQTPEAPVHRVAVRRIAAGNASDTRLRRRSHNPVKAPGPVRVPPPRGLDTRPGVTEAFRAPGAAGSSRDCPPAAWNATPVGSACPSREGESAEAVGWASTSTPFNAAHIPSWPARDRRWARAYRFRVQIGASQLIGVLENRPGGRARRSGADFSGAWRPRGSATAPGAPAPPGARARA